MRHAAIACGLLMVMVAAVFGAILLQRSPLPIGNSTPAEANAVAETTARSVVTTLEERAVPSALIATEKTAQPVEPAKSKPVVVAQTQTPVAAAQTQLQPTTPTVPSTPTCAGNPNALGVSRVVEIDTTGGPGFGMEHFKMHDFLRDHEVVLTFDDGPWPKNTQAVLAALAAHCIKAIFFPIGLHATYEPGILKQVAAAGHAVGSHTWCHQDLSKTKGHCRVNNKTETVEYDPKDEIEKGISAVRWAVGGPTAPYFRFPALRQPPELIEYLGKRNIAIFSTDLDSFDFKMRKPEEVKKSVLTRLKKFGKGIVLMHDFQHATAEATMDLLNQLKAEGYKIVFMKPKFPVTTLASYDEIILKQMKTAGGDGRPTSSVVRTISE
jgi:peptidoglycan/xylan/chitin deacetylase (PgdA/CDA1 family)